MPARALWKGYIRLGNIDVPVKLHTAVREERIQFHLLHRHDRIRLKQQMICAYEKVPVAPEEQVRGFQIEEGKYIIVDPAELEQIEPESNKRIEVHEFVNTGEIDPIFLDRVYYLEPDFLSKRYNALAEAMKEMKVEGICTWTMRKRSYFGALQIGGPILRLNALRYADDMISVADLKLPDISLSERELMIGKDLIDHLTASFQPEKFENEHQKKLQDFIARKSRGEKIAILRPRRLKPTTPDKLLETLEASLRKVA